MQNEISLAKFLARYCNMAGKDLSRMTHDDVEVMLPELKRTSFELVEKKPELLAQGIVLLVNDGFRTIPYLAPLITSLCATYQHRQNRTTGTVIERLCG